MPADSWYNRAARRWRKTHQGKPPTDSGGRDLLTSNKIAGPSWDVPVAATCAPSAVCATSCYAINPSRPITWSGTVNRQHLRLALATEDPTGTAERIAQEVQRRKLDHLTINGTGDLTDATVQMINALAPLIDPIPIWIRSRRPRQAAQLQPHPNVYLHFSLDRDSLHRRAQFEALAPRVQHFYSYQGARGELVQGTHGCALVFADGYNGDLLGDQVPAAARCPLHDRDPARPRASLVGACAACRRCFDGSLVQEQARLGRFVSAVVPA